MPIYNFEYELWGILFIFLSFWLKNAIAENWHCESCLSKQLFHMCWWSGKICCFRIVVSMPFLCTLKLYSVGNQIQMDVNVLKTDMSHWPRFCPLFLHTSPSTLWVLLVFLPLFLCLPVLTPALDSQTNLNIYPNSMHLHCTHFSCTFSAA